jgi:serine/threonine protein kinase
MIVVVCPGCHRRLQLADGPGGHEGRCTHCGQHVRFGTAPADPTLDTNETASGAVPETAGRPVTPVPAPAPAGASAPGYEFLAAPEQPDEIGRLGPYRVLQLLGQGAMGMVFRAEDTGLGRIVALKVMLPSVASLAENRQRFAREAQATALVNHPNVIPIYAIGEDRGVPFLAMPLLKGELLEARLNRERRLPIRDAVRIAREVAEGLAAAHQHNLIHRDIKPANLWLESVQRRNASDRVKILDFGLARMGDAGLTTPGAVLGTPAYMAPEQAKGATVDYRCDLFSLGCVMYRMLTGERPFQGGEVFAVLMALTTVHPPPPNELNAEIPPGLSELVMHLLAKEPDQRPQSAREVVDTLSRLGLISSVSSTDKVAIQRAGSSGSIPILSRADGSTTTASGRSYLLGVWAAIILLVCLAAFWARGLLASRPMGSVSLSVNPPDAEVFVDSEPMTLEAGNATTLNLAPGPHELKIYHKGFRGHTQTLQVTAGDNSPVAVELHKLPLEESAPPTPRPKDGAPKTPPAEKVPPPANEPPKKAATMNESKSAPPKPPAPREEIIPVPAPAKAKGEEVTSPKVAPGRGRGESPPETAPVVETKAPRPPINRRAALWVLERGGVVKLKVAGEAEATSVHTRASLPVGRFDVVMIGLAKKQGVDDAGLAVLEGLRELTALDLSGTAITDQAIAKLTGLRSLRILLLCDTGVTDGAVANLKQLTTLRDLNLQNTKISPAGVKELRTALPRCDITEP